jgi:ferritin-like metal-binding protein YciE
MPDNPRKKKQDRKRQSKQKHEVAYRNRARGGKSPSRKASRNKRSTTNRSRPAQRNRSQSRASSNRGRSTGPTMRELLIDEMADIYNAEKQLVRALPKMGRAATSEQLKTAFEQHLDETREQVRRIEQAFEALGEKPKSKKCDAMEGLIKEGQKVMEEDFEDSVLDAALIAAAQKVEHYEIASYGTICTWVEMLGENAALRFLKQTMSEEEATDKRLTDIAIQVNRDAQNQGDSEGEEGNGRGTGKTGIRDLVSRVFPS